MTRALQAYGKRLPRSPVATRGKQTHTHLRASALPRRLAPPQKPGADQRWRLLGGACAVAPWTSIRYRIRCCDATDESRCAPIPKLANGGARSAPQSSTHPATACMQQQNQTSLGKAPPLRHATSSGPPPSCLLSTRLGRCARDGRNEKQADDILRLALLAKLATLALALKSAAVGPVLRMRQRGKVQEGWRCAATKRCAKGCRDSVRGPPTLTEKRPCGTCRHIRRKSLQRQPRGGACGAGARHLRLGERAPRPLRMPLATTHT